VDLFAHGLAFIMRQAFDVVPQYLSDSDRSAVELGLG
jgi:hypothetical protein